MTPVAPKEPHLGARLVVFAQDQPQYTLLPASVSPDGLVMTEWEPAAEELSRLLDGARLRIWLYTFNTPLQPINVEVAQLEARNDGRG